MKIWIVSSDPFYRDFEKISEHWASDNEIVISLISKYGYNPSSIYNFCKIYLNLKPDTIITDHGYFGFWFIKFLSRLFKVNTRFNFYLRGNYWLEERIRSEKAH